MFEVRDEVRPYEVAGLLEGVVDLLVGFGVVYVYAEGVHYVVALEVGLVVARWGWVLVWVSWLQEGKVRMREVHQMDDGYRRFLGRRTYSMGSLLPC